MAVSSTPRSVLLLIAGAKGAVGSTVAAAVAALRHHPERVLPSLTSGGRFHDLIPPESLLVAGWDVSSKPLVDVIADNAILPESTWKPYQQELQDIQIFDAPAAGTGIERQIDRTVSDIQSLRTKYPEALPVLIDLLPAAPCINPADCRTIEQLYAAVDPKAFRDLAYVLAAIEAGIPVVNFSPNAVEFPPVVDKATANGVPLAGRDGKTGQTYLKVVLASALSARRLYIDGWYSLNILGNADGANLMDPHCAEGKLTNKTDLLDDILGYSVGERYGESAHQVRIDYYPPRGDAKEAWDVIDFKGLFGMPMSLRINLQGRDSILAAPMVIDLARWSAVLQLTGYSGPVPELGFFFKKPVGDSPPVSYDEQIRALKSLEQSCLEKLEGMRGRDLKFEI